MTVMRTSTGATAKNMQSDVAVLVTGPTFKNDVGGIVVEPERYETVQVAEEKHGSGLLSFFGNMIKDPSSSTPVEMGEMGVGKSEVKGDPAVRVVSSPTRRGGSAADFDVCREYSYTTDEETGDGDEESGKTEQRTSLKSFVLGRSYDPIHNFHDRRGDEGALFWFTYRCDFPEIVPYGIRSDAGWGCMLRSAQMLLGQSLRVHFKSRGWKPPQHFQSRRKDPFVRSMLTWFADFPSVNQCYYSLHNMVAAGLKYDKLPGEWYGPGAACYVLRDLVEMHERQQQANPNMLQQRRIFRVYVAPQGTIYRNAIDDLVSRESKAKLAEATAEKHKVNPQSHPLDLDWEEELVETVGHVEWDTGLLLLVPLRLGLNSFNPDYVQAVAHTFSFPQSVGVLGGRVRGARWFYGAVSDGSQVFGLDPHTVQNAPRSRVAQVNGQTCRTVDLSDDYLRSCHTTYPEVLSLQKMDPSIALGFYCRDEADLENLFDLVKEWKKCNPDQPELFSIADAAPSYAADASPLASGSDSLLDGDDNSALSHASGEDDDFVML